MFSQIKLIIYTFVLFFIIGCGGGGSSGDTTPSTSSFSGIAVDGYISGATACLDIDSSGTCDDGEPTTTTDASGNFTFSNLTVDSNTYYPVIVSGGIDTATGKNFEGELKNIISSDDIITGNELTVSPLTDLVATSFMQSDSKNEAALSSSKTTIAEALGIDETTIDADTMTDTKAFAKAQEIQQVKELIKTTASKASSSELTLAQQNNITSALVTQLNSDSTLDVTKVLTNVETNLSITIADYEKTFIVAQADQIQIQMETIANDATLDLTKLDEIQNALETEIEEATNIINNATSADTLTAVIISDTATLISSGETLATNTRPYFLDGSNKITSKTISLNENETLSLSSLAEDDDENILTYSLSGVDKAYFSIDLNGDLTSIQTFDYENKLDSTSNNTYTLQIIANDGIVNSYLTIFVEIQNINDNEPEVSNVTTTTSEDIAKTGTLIGTDLDNDTLTFSKVTDPSNGTVVINSNGSYTYTPNENYNGNDSFTYKANDGTDDSNTATVNISIGAVNDAPVLNTISNQTTAEDTPKTVTLSATDADGDDLSYTATSSTNVTASVNGTTLTLTPDLNFNGTQTISVKVSDGTADDTKTFDITVSAVNDAMTGFEMNTANNFTEDSTSAGYTVTTVKTAPSDEDGGDITYSISDTTNYAINATTGAVTLTAAGAAEVNAGNDLPAFNVTATSANIDGEGSSTSTVSNLDPAVTTVNDDLTTFEIDDVANFTEDSTSAGYTVTTVKTAPSDEDGGDITYSISDTTNYAINATTGAVTLTAAGAAEVNAGNDLPAFNVTATSANIDGEGSSTSTVSNLDPAVTTVNDDLTTFEIDDVANFTEDSTSAGYTVTTVKTAPSDEDGGDITYSISDTTNYAINATTGAVTLTAAGAAEVNAGNDLPAFNVTATSANIDGEGSSTSTVSNLDPAVTTVNDDLTTFEIDDVANFTEDSTSAGYTVTTVKTAPSDEDGGDITYSISDTTNYAINATTGAVTLTAAGAAEVNAGNDLPAFNVTATSANIDGEGSSTSTVSNLDPAVTTVNDDLTTFEIDDVANFTEDSTSAGYTVTTVKTAPSDEDGGDITYSISDTTNYAINATTGAVTLTAAGAAEVNAGNDLPAFNVTATSANIDGEGSSTSTVSNLDPAVTTVNDDLTTFEIDDVANFTEDSTSAGYTVTTVKTAPSDEDGGDITYSISDTTNYAINATTGAVTLTAAGAAEVNAGNDLPAFNVTATSANIDGEGSSTSTVSNLDPAVTTVNDDLTTFEIDDVANFTEDSTSAGYTVTTVKTAPSDEDGGDITYSISDTTNYAINATTGAVTLTAAGAAEVNAGNDLPAFNVTATSANIDGEGSSTSTVSNLDPAVTTVNDDLTTFEIDDVANFTEDSTSVNDEVTTVKTVPTDEDGGAITYSINGNTNGYYAINSSTGKVTLTQTGADLVNSGSELPAFTVTATSEGDNGSSQTSSSLDPSVTTVNDDMTGFEMYTANDFTEDSTSVNDEVTTVKTVPTDEDGGAITYSINGNTNGYYAINSSTGKVTLTQTGADLVNSGSELPAFTVTATSEGDNGSSQTSSSLDPSVLAQNDAPTAQNSSLTVNINTATDGEFDASDVDSESLDFTITTNPSNGSVIINADGTYTYTPNTDFVGNDSFVFKANDGSLDSNTATISIAVVDYFNPANNDFSSVKVERGPVLFSTVTDSARYEASKTNEGFSNIYSFSDPSTVTLPIKATGGYIDVNRNGFIDEDDIKLDIELSSYTSTITPITTAVGNDVSKLQYFIDEYSLTKDQLIKSVPSEESVEALILSNAIFMSLKDNSTFDENALSFTSAISNLGTYYDENLSNESDLDILATSLEDYVIGNIENYSKLTFSDLTTFVSDEFGVELLDVNESGVFAKNHLTTDTLSNIWDLVVPTELDQSIEDFNINLVIEKPSSKITAIVSFESLSINNNVLSSPSSIIFHARQLNESGTIQDQTTRIYPMAGSSLSLGNSVKILNGNLYLNFSYIIETIAAEESSISINSFLSIADYNVKIYTSNLKVKNSNILVVDENFLVYNGDFIYINNLAGTNSLSGTINIK